MDFSEFSDSHACPFISILTFFVVNFSVFATCMLLSERMRLVFWCYVEIVTESKDCRNRYIYIYEVVNEVGECSLYMYAAGDSATGRKCPAARAISFCSSISQATRRTFLSLVQTDRKPSATKRLLCQPSWNSFSYSSIRCPLRLTDNWPVECNLYRWPASIPGMIM